MLFRVLGSVDAAAGGQRAAVSGRRRAILAVLLAADGRTVTTDRLVDAIWGDDPPPSARKSLQSHVSRLRARLQEIAPDEPEAVVSEPDGYRVDLDAHDLDARTFLDLVDPARRAEADDGGVAVLVEADAWWRGPAFGDLATHPAVRTAASHLEQVRASATADRMDALLAGGRAEDAMAELPAVVERDPYDERAVGQLMRALVACGRQGEALAAYRELQARLRDELGVDPSSPLSRLHEDILRQDPTVAPATAPAPAPEPPATARRGDRLLGRERDVETLTTWVRTTPLVTLTGPGGVGKTRVAETVVERVAPTFRDGVATCALAHVREAEGVGGALITALGIQPTGEQTVEQALVSALGDRHLLLFLDNCEHVLDALLPPLEAVLAQCRDVTLLATSRERLRLPGEHVWPVTPLDVPSSEASVDEVVGTSAGELFRLRAAAVDPAFALTAGNAGAVGELCRRLDGMPLAIELAAARARALAPSALVERLDQRFAVLAGGPRHEGGRHRTLQAVVGWSYDLLAPAEADLFDRLAVFAGAFPLAAVEEVCSSDGVARADVAGLLGELVDKSMVVVQRTGEDVRYRLLDTMREFALGRLDERGITEDLRRAHAAHYRALAETQGARIRGPEEQQAGAVIAGAVDDLRAAHAWAVAAGDVDVALRLPAALVDEIMFRLRDEVTSWARRALALPGAADHPAYVGALTASAVGATSRDECERAVREATEALALEPDGLVAVLAVGALMTAALYEGRLDDVLAFAKRLDAMTSRLRDDYHRAFAGVCRVLAHLYRAEQDHAEEQVTALRGLADELGNPTMRAFARYCDGEVHLDTRPDEAAVTLQEAVGLARSVDNQLLRGVSLVSLASLQGRRGEIQDALRLFREVVAHWRRLGDHTHQLTTLRNLVELLAHVGADEPAAVLYGAVTAGDTPSFGVEAERLAAAWQQVEQRLGTPSAGRLAEQGRGMSATQVGDEALIQLDALLQGQELHE